MLSRRPRPEEDDADELESFIDDDEGGEDEWRKELRAITGGYDPSK